MVDAHDQDAGRLAVLVAVVLDQVHLPQRTHRIERLHRQPAHQVLQGGLLPAAGDAGQLFTHDVGVDVQLRVFHPGGAGGVFDHALAKARVLEQAFLDALADSLVVQARLQDPEADDHHQVGRRVHAHPGTVDLAHALATRDRGQRGGGPGHVVLHQARRVQRGVGGHGADLACEHQQRIISGAPGACRLFHRRGLDDASHHNIGPWGLEML